MEIPAEVCGLCGAAVASEHQHLVEPSARELHCVCDACAVLFDGRTKYRRVPRRVRAVADLRLEDEQWDALLIPIGVAFFFHSSAAGRVVALYPSPGGPMESALDLKAWDDIASANPVLARLEPDVEGLLVNRTGEARDYYLVPIDECYRLSGIIRTHWRGLSGGALVWEQIRDYFDGLRERSGKGGRHA